MLRISQGRHFCLGDPPSPRFGETGYAQAKTCMPFMHAFHAYMFDLIAKRLRFFPPQACPAIAGSDGGSRSEKSVCVE